MAKKTTTTKSIAADGAKAVPSAVPTDHAPPADPPAPAKRKAAKKAPLVKAAPAKAPTARKKATQPIVRAGFSNEDVALRAYYIAEKRVTAGLPGDSHSDWIEAERQLRKEHGRKG